MKQHAVSLIRKLRISKGCKYILFLPQDTGITPWEASKLMDTLKQEGYDEIVGVMVKDTRGIRVLENEATTVQASEPSSVRTDERTNGGTER